MKNIITLITFFLAVNFAKGQIFTDSLFLHLYNYEVIKGELKEGLNLSELEQIFNIEELVDSVNNESFKIYKFYHLEYEEALTSYLVMDKNNIEIYDILSFDVLIERLLGVNELCEKSKAACIKEVLNALRSYYEVVDMEKLVIQKDYGKYHYYLPLVNFKNKEGVIK